MSSWELQGKSLVKKRNAMLILIGIIGISLVLNLTAGSAAHNHRTSCTESKNLVELGRQPALLASNKPISINGDAELISKTNGTYIIEDLVIDNTGPSQHAISVLNTLLPFEIRNCTLIGVKDVSALLLYYVSNCTLFDVRAVSNEQVGMELYGVHNITIAKCNVTENWKGITMSMSSLVEISNCTIQSNSNTGVALDSSSTYNEMYWNAFAYNYINAQDDDASLRNNFTENFWSNYLGVDTDRDRKGDTPHIILQSYGNTDPVPLMLPPDRPPVYWREAPEDEVREYGDSIVIELKAAVNGGLKSWYLNDSRFSISDTGVIINEDWIPVGYYGINATVVNQYDDVLTGLFNLHVQDTILPTWIEVPTNQVVEIGEPFLYDVNATDLSIPLYYWLESSPFFEVNSATGEIQNNDTLLSYVPHAVHIFVRDAESLQINATFTVTAQDTQPPEWDEALTNQIIEYGYALSYDIDASDYSGLDTWSVNDTRFQIESSGILSNATVLSLGTYTLEVSVNDTIGNLLTGVVTVTVQDTTPPEWVVWPTNQILERGTSLSLQLQVSDNAEVAYWTVSDEENFDITTLGLLFNTRDLDQVAYTLVVTAYDSSGNSVYSSFSITIQDTLNPTWVTPLTNYTFEFGNIVRIPLEAHDYSGLTGWAVDESSLFSIDDTGVIRNVTSLQVGLYTIHVSVSDVVGHFLYRTLTVNVQDTIAPSWSNVPSSLYVTAPDTVAYQLSVFDLSGISHWDVNDTDNFLVNQQAQLVGLIALPAGTYHIEITAYDPYENHATVTITIHAYGHNLTIIAMAAGIWGIASLLAVTMFYLFNPKKGRLAMKGGEG